MRAPTWLRFHSGLEDSAISLALALWSQACHANGRNNAMSRDLRLREDVERELGWEPVVPCSEIGVGVKDGVVTLMGLVDNYEAKHAAERAAIRVPGVKALSSQLQVRPVGPAGR